KDGAGKFTATEKYGSKAVRAMINDHGGVVLVNGFVYGYSDGKGWLCQDLEGGKEKWKESRELDGKGSLTYADGNLYLLSDEGEAALIKATPEGWQEKGRFNLPEKS